MPVLGIDQSLLHTGVFAITEGGFYPSQIDTEPRRGAERLLFIRDAVRTVLDTFKPELVAMEGYAYGSVGRLAELGELGGTLKVLFQEHGIPVIVVAPIQVKKFIAGHSNAEKIDVVHAVNKRFNLNWTEDENNMADAAALALIAKAYLDPSSLTTRNEVEVIAKLRGTVTITRKKKRKLPRNHFHKI